MYRPTPLSTPTPALLAEWTGGQLISCDAPEQNLGGLATLGEANADDFSFFASAKLKTQAAESKAALLICPEGIELDGRATLLVPEVWTAIAAIMDKLYATRPEPSGVHPTAVIGEGVTLGEGVSIGAYSVIGDGASIGAGSYLGPHCIIATGCEIGSDCLLSARVTCTGLVRLGDRVTIHPGAVLGADGFKFEWVGGKFVKIPQIGMVIVGNDAEIGANTCVDRAFLNETTLGEGTKLDNLVQIGHNAQIGPHNVIAGLTASAGSVQTGPGCMIGGTVSIADGIKIGPGSIVGGKAGVMQDLPPGSKVVGAPAMEWKQFFKTQAAIKKLPEYAKRLQAIETKLAALQPSETQEK